jgi:hypothetical protein
MDYPNNMLTHPSDWNSPESIAFIIYYDDSNDCCGNTSIVSRNGNNDEIYKPPYINMPGNNGFKFFNNKNNAENYFKENFPNVYTFRQKIYNREKYVNFIPGTVLVYRHDIWHRGTPIKPYKFRRVQNLGFRKAQCEWITTWNSGWIRKMYSNGQFVEYLFSYLDNEQLECLGLPNKNSKYWNTYNKKNFLLRWKPYNFKYEF